MRKLRQVSRLDERENLDSDIQRYPSRRVRGERQYSTDIEDIISLLDGRSSLEEEVGQADAEVREFLSEWFAAELETLMEIASAFLSSVAKNSGRGQILRERISRLAR